MKKRKKRNYDICSPLSGIAFFPIKYFWRRYPRNIKMVFKRCVYLLKNGLPEQATWETYEWFRVSMIKALKGLLKWGNSYPPDRTPEQWENELRTAIHHLEMMDESNPFYEDNFEPFSIEIVTLMNEHKDAFMEWFSKNFYTLWD